MRWLRQMPPTPCNIAAKSLRRWWLTPPRPCLHRLISPWEYRHLGVFGVMRVAAGGFQLGIGLVLLSLGRSAETDQERRKMYRLSAWFLVPAALNLVGGSWYITCDRLPRLPLAMFEEVHPPAPQWPDAPAAYLQLSEAYQDWAAKAQELGWPATG